MNGIWSKTILRSRNAAAPQHVLSTLLLRMPRIVLAEWNTHRCMSRNAASTRAIPTEKLIQQVLDDPFVPISWGLNIPGMQAKGEHLDPEQCRAAWLEGRDRAVATARSLLGLGLHKQIVGRVLEPWMWTIVCASSTEWSNFLALRDHPDAEPHIAVLAREIRKCLDDESTIKTLEPGEWHLPFVTSEDRWKALDAYGTAESRAPAMEALKKLSVARAASTSYKTVDGFDMTLERAVALHDKLVGATPLHASPCEHIAQADHYLGPAKTVEVPVHHAPGDHNAGYGQTHKVYVPAEGAPRRDWSSEWLNPEQHRNFVGFRQYRAMLPGECQ
ncbi:ThyX [EBPR siphovirus 2]|nr:ThyX [EBPR siphovirus 2]